MKKYLKNSAIVMVAVLVFTLVGCGTNDTQDPGDTNNNGSNNEEPVELTVVMAAPEWGGSDDPDMQKAFKEYAEEKTGYKINMIAPPHNGYIDRLNIMLVSGEYLDVAQVQRSATEVPNYATTGKIIPITDLVKNAETINNVYGENPDWFETYIVNDEIYGVPSTSPVSQGLWIRKDILDKYDAKVPTTTEEFKTEMKKIGDGIIPFTFPKHVSNFQYFYNAFGAQLGFVQDENGNWIDGFNTPEMKKALEYVASLYKEGILDKEFMVNENNTMREKQWAGQAASSIYWTRIFAMYDENSKAVNPDAENVFVPALEGPDGHKKAFNLGISDAYVIGAKSKNPEAAMDYIEWFRYSNEGLTARAMGIEGYAWEDNGEFKLTAAGKEAGYSENPYTNHTLLQTPIFMEIDVNLDEQYKEVYNTAVSIKEDAMTYDSNTVYNVPAGISETYDNYVRPEYSSKTDELVTKVVMGDITIEEAYQEYDNWSKAINLDKAIEELNQ